MPDPQVRYAEVTGESQIFVVRGNPRLGYELNVKIQWRGSFDGGEVSGDLEIPALESDDADGFELKMKPAPDPKSKAAATAIKEKGREVVKAEDVSIYSSRRPYRILTCGCSKTLLLTCSCQRVLALQIHTI